MIRVRYLVGLMLIFTFFCMRYMCQSVFVVNASLNVFGTFDNVIHLCSVMCAVINSSRNISWEVVVCSEKSTRVVEVLKT